MENREYRRAILSRMYSRRLWHCHECDRRGLVLVKESDSEDRMEWRRAHSHQAQATRRVCSGERLAWQEQPREAGAHDGLTPHEAYRRGYATGYNTGYVTGLRRGERLSSVPLQAALDHPRGPLHP
jgi:hypothetical protein